MQDRTKQFSLRVLKLVSALPENTQGRAIANQLVRSGMSVGANYRSACRARSRADFINKLGIVEEEADECAFWIELIIESGSLPKKSVQPLLNEANDLVSIIVASKKTTRRKTTNRKSKIENRK